ncbi:hypothetical protein E2C01_046848 [Portunus trituberculatus]|uniref:Uncharacterized protein n=1 Tax=Portunus trituberculatus TaxID=210409 RepID=A0A5B7G648_PORTR|nr:hypothetical protein [Portunus trituberculatus]
MRESSRGKRLFEPTRYGMSGPVLPSLPSALRLTSPAGQHCSALSVPQQPVRVRQEEWSASRPSDVMCAARLRHVTARKNAEPHVWPEVLSVCVPASLRLGLRGRYKIPWSFGVWLACR